MSSLERTASPVPVRDLDSSSSTTTDSTAMAQTSSTTPSLKGAVPPERISAPSHVEDDKANEAGHATDLPAFQDSEKQQQSASEATVANVGFDYPDGGLRAWLYEQFQLSSYTESEISWIGSFQLASVLWFAVLAGRAFDGGYVKWLLLAGVVLYTAGLLGLSWATTYGQIFAAQALAPGIASGIIFVPAVSSVSHWFRKRRAFALGILSTGSSIGGVVYPLILNSMFRSVGFGWTVRTVALLTMSLLIFAAITINSRLPPRSKGKMIDFKYFKDLEFSLFVIAESLIMLGLYLPYYYIQNYALQNGVAENVAFYSLSILNAASLFGRIIPNWLADKYGPFTILIPNCFASGFLIFAWIGLCKSTAGTVVFCVLFGFASGAYVSMMPACVACMTPPNRMDEIGIRIAMAFLVVSVAALCGTPINGAIVTANDGSYVESAIFSGVVVLAGSVVNVGTHYVLRRRKGTFWV
ncbi:hypothetical protein OIO90_004612 [Microbotryomycetes sp. JL221]|nr:hypothetical protein OIO90_004612 [Microbotryomycetes sp. JL221]